jgi:hypothetical protein
MIGIPVGTLTLVCSTTQGEVCSGAIYSRGDLARTRKTSLLLMCPYCCRTHVFRFARARLRPIGSALRPPLPGAA